MAAPGVWSNWLAQNDAPLRPEDLPSQRELERLWDDTEQDVFLSAFEPGAGEPRPQHADWLRKPENEDAVIFREVMNGR